MIGPFDFLQCHAKDIRFVIVPGSLLRDAGRAEDPM
jgi:hypothetical protein